MDRSRTIAENLRLFWEPGQVSELRVLKAPGAGTVSGYFDDADKMAKAAAEWSGKAPGVYWVLNPVTPALLARASNRVVRYAKEGTATSDKDVIKRRWFLIDFDPVRPSGISATDPEKHQARLRARQCRDLLTGRGWPRPICGDSGNGYHLIYRIELANDTEAADLLRRCLEALCLKFSDKTVKVDTTTFNAARICKVYGTQSCKGDSTAERPHRQTAVIEVPG